MYHRSITVFIDYRLSCYRSLLQLLLRNVYRYLVTDQLYFPPSRLIIIVSSANIDWRSTSKCRYLRSRSRFFFLFLSLFLLSWSLTGIFHRFIFSIFFYFFSLIYLKSFVRLLMIRTSARGCCRSIERSLEQNAIIVGLQETVDRVS